ncbi:MAG: hypothetical protein IKZ68_03205, partial [Bacilli bacterium]|nr:hypothetical protein [Bacilli bacterium]
VRRIEIGDDAVQRLERVAHILGESGEVELCDRGFSALEVHGYLVDGPARGEVAAVDDHIDYAVLVKDTVAAKAEAPVGDIASLADAPTNLLTASPKE